MHAQLLLTVLCSTLSVAFPFSPSKLFSSESSSARPVNVRDLMAECTPESYDIKNWEYIEFRDIPNNKSGGRVKYISGVQFPEPIQPNLAQPQCAIIGNKAALAANDIECLPRFRPPPPGMGSTAQGQVTGPDGNMVGVQIGNVSQGDMHFVHSWACQGKFFMSSTRYQIPNITCTNVTTALMSRLTCVGPPQPVFFAPQEVIQICQDETMC